MFAPPVLQVLEGDRLHMSHGPIDIVLKAWGHHDAVRAAYAAAWGRFPQILPELCDELAALRAPLAEGRTVEGPVARRMVDACRPFAPIFVTPMAAVAGAVADELLAHMRQAAPLAKAFVNDGGDIAVHVMPGETLAVGIAGEYSRGDSPALNASLALDSQAGIGGIATSGAQGRSFSLGIADSVTVLASNAACADVAATLIANAVDISSPQVTRKPARSLDPDSDLGDRLVTVHVGRLAAREISDALDAGLARAEAFRQAQLIAGAALMLQGTTRLAGGAGLLAEPITEQQTGEGSSP